MKALTVRDSGHIEIEKDAELRPLERGLARVRLRYAGVGFADLMAVRGGYPLAPSRPFSPGYEFLGAIEESGSTGLPEGLRVAGVLPRMGAYREFIDLSPDLLLPLPPGLADESAALLPLNYLTALAMIERCAGLARGQSFLIHGGAGGVGTAALELARLLGLRAYGSASSAKHELIASLGGIPLRREGGAWAEELKLREPGGLDAAFDAFGIRSFRSSWRALAPRGCLVCYGISPSVEGGTADFVAGLLYLATRKALGAGRRVRICATPSIVGKDRAWYRASLARILDWAAEGALRPTLAGILPWFKAAEAHSSLAKGSVKGKLLLDFS